MGIRTPFSRLMLVLMVSGLPACTATNDVERLDHTMSRKLDTLTANFKEELRDLKSVQRAQDKRQEDLAKSVDALKTAIYANVEAMGRSYESLDRSTKRLANRSKPIKSCNSICSPIINTSRAPWGPCKPPSKVSRHWRRRWTSKCNG
jgi:septal ring factor EnvC (AmiA/AmiB activator)